MIAQSAGRTVLALVLAASAILGCRTRDDASVDAAAAGAGAVESGQDSTPATSDTALTTGPAQSDPSGQLTGETRKESGTMGTPPPPKPRPPVAGRDSAFGPRYELDSAGRVVPIRQL